MGSNSTQGVAVMLFLAAFTFVSWGLFADGSFLFLAIGLVGLAASFGLFVKAKPWEHMSK